MDEVTSLQGPVETVGGKLTLRIPLDAGGRQLAASARGIAQVEGNFLNVTIPEWLAAKLGIKDGSLVSVDNRNGKFNLFPVQPS